jgi:glycerol-3-phosphate O-acyltransferase
MCKAHTLKKTYTVLVFDLITEIINLQERDQQLLPLSYFRHMVQHIGPSDEALEVKCDIMSAR